MSAFRYWVILVLLLQPACPLQPSFSYNITTIDIIFVNDQGQQEKIPFSLPYSARHNIGNYLKNFAIEHKLDVNLFINSMNDKLQAIGIGDFADEAISSSDAVMAMLHGYSIENNPSFELQDTVKKPLYFMGHSGFIDSPSNPQVDLLFLLREATARPEELLPSQLAKGVLPTWIADKHRIIVYQSRGVNTGGTAALNSLFENLSRLGYNVTLCFDHNHNSNECTRLDGSEVVVTGEWCDGVLREYGIATANVGRGVQYHLGFHQASGSYRGRVPVAVSHYLHASLSNRIMGAFYLGCPMKDAIKNAFTDLVQLQSLPHQSRVHLDIFKENLVLIDPDLFNDYTPMHEWIVTLPSEIRLVSVEKIPSSQMPLLLQRAKVVVDLALPGAERLTMEAVLMGAVPIVSNRWNGASEVDFPHVIRVDHQNLTQVAEAIVYAVENYEKIIINQNSRHQASKFMAYVMSLWRRSYHTTDVYFGSSFLHFVLLAPTLDTEMAANLQILALLHIFPLASIDLYVTDPMWYVRHHYSFHTTLRDGGYIRKDRLDSNDQSIGGDISFVRLLSIIELRKQVSSTDVETISDLKLFLPAWSPAVVVMETGVIIASPAQLFESLSKMNTDKDALTLQYVSRTGRYTGGCILGNMASVHLLSEVISPISTSSNNAPTNEYIILEHMGPVHDLLSYQEVRGTSRKDFYYRNRTRYWIDRCQNELSDVQRIDEIQETLMEEKLGCCTFSSGSSSMLLSEYMQSLLDSLSWRKETDFIWQTMNCQFLRRIMLSICNEAY